MHVVHFMRVFLGPLQRFLNHQVRFILKARGKLEFKVQRDIGNKFPVHNLELYSLYFPLTLHSIPSSSVCVFAMIAGTTRVSISVILTSILGKASPR